MGKSPCLVSLQNGTRIIAVVHALLIIVTSGYLMYKLGHLINSNEVSHVHSAKGVVSTLNEYFEKYGLVKPPTQKMKRTAEITLGKDVANTADKLQEMNTKAIFFSSRYVDDLKVQQEIVILLLLLVIMLIILMLDVNLFQGANERNYAMIKIWYRTFFVLYVSALTCATPVIIAAVDYEFNWKFYAVGATKVVAGGYVLYMVNAFMQQIQLESGKTKGGKKTK